MATVTTALAPPRSVRSALVVAGPVVVVSIAAVTSQVGDPRAVANVALLLAVVTVLVAMTTVVGGVTTSIAGAFALNYFHTEPVHSLRMTETSDVVAVLLLAGLGLAVSGMTAVRLRDVARQRHGAIADDALTTLTVSNASRPAVDLWHDVVTACSADLALVRCRVEQNADPALPHVALHRGRLDDDSLVLPATGARIDVADPRLGLSLVLTPTEGAGAVAMDRRVVTALADQASLALSRATATA